LDAVKEYWRADEGKRPPWPDQRTAAATKITDSLM